MYTYTIICFGAEIGFGEGDTFEWARFEATEQAKDAGAWYPEDDWGFITKNPAGLTISYNV